jgi:hypothetical protein
MKEKLIKEMVNRINNMKEVIDQLEQSMEHISKVIMENNPAYSGRVLETQSRLAFKEINPLEHEMLYVKSTIINQQFDEFTNGKSMYDNNLEFDAKELRENKYGEKVLYYFAMLYHINRGLMDLFIKDLTSFIMRTTELSDKHYNMMIRKTELELEFALLLKTLFNSNDKINILKNKYNKAFTEDECSLYMYYISSSQLFNEKDTKDILDTLNSLDNISNFDKNGF